MAHPKQAGDTIPIYNNRKEIRTNDRKNA